MNNLKNLLPNELQDRDKDLKIKRDSFFVEREILRTKIEELKAGEQKLNSLIYLVSEEIENISTEIKTRKEKDKKDNKNESDRTEND